MKLEATATGSTIEEAIANARAQLGIGEEVEIDHEIIDLPEKKFLGLFGGKPAKVTVSYDDGKSEPKPTRQKKAKSDRPAKAEKPAKAERPAPAKREKPAKAEKPARSEKQFTPVELNKESLERTVNFVKDMLSHMKLGEFTCEVIDVEGGFCINIEGTGMGAVIGRRGETLDAIQYLASLCYNNNEDGFTRVVIDTNNYRAKREETLASLAVRVAERAARTGHNQALEPMNPYERRVIHTAVQDIEGMTSWSVSDGRGRRVIIGAADENGNPVNADERPRSRSDRGDRGYGRDNRRGCHGGRNGRGGRDSRRTAPAEPTREKRSDATDLPLFGRIDK